MVTESVKAVIILDGDGHFFDLRWTNEKGHRKSIENSRLWHLHQVTSRLLEYDKPHRLTAIEDRGAYLVARMDGLVLRASTEPIQEFEQPAFEDTRDFGASGTDEAVPAQAAGPVSTEILTGLADIIARRHIELPEGSYTSYLFKQGPAKIRKKTGEEAVELLLANRPEELVHEAADLIYHLLVLLEAEGIGLAPLLAELATRGK